MASPVVDHLLDMPLSERLVQMRRNKKAATKANQPKKTSVPKTIVPDRFKVGTELVWSAYYKDLKFYKIIKINPKSITVRQLETNKVFTTRESSHPRCPVYVKTYTWSDVSHEDVDTCIARYDAKYDCLTYDKGCLNIIPKGRKVYVVEDDSSTWP